MSQSHHPDATTELPSQGLTYPLGALQARRVVGHTPLYAAAATKHDGSDDDRSPARPTCARHDTCHEFGIAQIQQ